MEEREAVKKIKICGITTIMLYGLWKTGNKSGIIRHIVVEFQMINGRNIDVKTKIDYYSRLSVCGENDSDTGTF